MCECDRPGRLGSTAEFEPQMGDRAGIAEVGPLQCLDEIGNGCQLGEVREIGYQAPQARNGERHAVVAANQRVELHA